MCLAKIHGPRVSAPRFDLPLRVRSSATDHRGSVQCAEGQTGHTSGSSIVKRYRRGTNLLCKGGTMRMFDVQGIEIRAARDRLFKFVSDPRNLPKWARAFK